MLHWLQIVLALVMAYLIGSIPTSVWLSRSIFKIDVRKHGSGNAGATNTMRTLGLKAGLVVLVFDIFKGWFAVYIPHFVYTDGLTPTQFTWFSVGLATAAVLGHVFPVYVGFKGGKGMATLVGVMLGLHPNLLICVVVVFIIVFLIGRIVSLASIAAAVATPLATWFIFEIHDPIFMLFSIVVAVFVPFMHRKNIQRMMKGEEKRFTYKRRTENPI
ncbi:MAG: glycerol-3-phosphate 1-O-acyltransferase PlsY [Bacteroidota bacterium]